MIAMSISCISSVIKIRTKIMLHILYILQIIEMVGKEDYSVNVCIRTSPVPD